MGLQSSHRFQSKQTSKAFPFGQPTNQPATMSSDNSVSTQTTAASSSVQSASRPVLPKKVVMDVPAGTSEVYFKTMLEKFYGKVNFVDICQVYPDRTLALLGSVATRTPPWPWKASTAASSTSWSCVLDGPFRARPERMAVVTNKRGGRRGKRRCEEKTVRVAGLNSELD